MADPSAAPQRRAPAPVGWLLAMSLGLVIVLAGPLLLFNPWFVAFEQARNEVPTLLGTSQAQVDSVTASIVGDLFTGGDFTEGLASSPLLTADERSHMRDVGGLVRALAVILAVATTIAVVCVVLLRRERRRVGRLLLIAGGVTGSLAVVLAALFAVAFDQAFLAFHEVFFPGGNFLFGPDSNLLRLFPEGFWFEVSLVAGALIIATATAATLVGWRLARF
ncbi:MAG: DUF1461 domain-containing protein [Chloroflexota bacterium]|nr:DUF1461 domain-containing protein [Chloroflexota bacterium]